MNCNEVSVREYNTDNFFIVFRNFIKLQKLIKWIAFALALFCKEKYVQEAQTPFFLWSLLS